MMTDVYLDVDGLSLHGQLYQPDKEGPHPTICVCHGIPSGKSDSSEPGYPDLAKKLSEQGFAAFIFNFRGTGASGGNLDMLGWTHDLQAAIGYLLRRPETGKLGLLGFSAGAAVSIFVAARDNHVSAVASCACPANFRSIEEAGNVYGFVQHLRSIGVIRDPDFPHSLQAWAEGFRLVSPISYIAIISPRPVLLVHGDRDDVVDVEHARLLYEKAREPKRLVIIPGAGHRLRHHAGAMSLVTEWLKEQLG